MSDDYGAFTLGYLRSLPWESLRNIIIHDEELMEYNKLSAVIDYIYPTNPKLFNKLDPQNAKLYSDLEYSIYYAAYAYFMAVLGDPQDINIIESTLPLITITPERAGYYLGIDGKQKIILLVIRGTETLGDALTDINAEIELANIGDEQFRVHKGIWHATEYIDRQVREKLKNYVAKYPGYRIIITGHSLGAGICSLLGLIYQMNQDTQQLYDKMDCYSFASPCVIERTGCFVCEKIISVALTTDIVTRLSLEGFNRLSERIRIINEDSEVNSEKINNICNKRIEEEKEFGEEEKEFKEEEFINNIENVNINHDNLLYPVGKILWFIPEFMNTNNKYESLLKQIHIQDKILFKLLRLLEKILNNYFKLYLQCLLTKLYKIDDKLILCEINNHTVENKINNNDNNNDEDDGKDDNKTEDIVKMNENDITTNIVESNSRPMSPIPYGDPDSDEYLLFQQMVYLKIQSITSHSVGSYTNAFNINIEKIFDMSQIFQPFIQACTKTVTVPENSFLKFMVFGIYGFVFLPIMLFLKFLEFSFEKLETVYTWVMG